MKKNTKIFIAGHKGMVGSSLVRILKKNGYKNLIFFSRNVLDFENYEQTFKYLKKTKPDILIIAAAKVGGINANNIYAYDFIYKNLLIEINLIHAAYKNNIKKLIFLGSSCVYPKFSKQPIAENNLLEGSLEFTNRSYSIAKISGIELCASLNRQFKKKFLSVMPCNLYGPNDNYDLLSSHVLPALIRKIHLAKQKKQKFITLWGSGKPLREFMFVDDLSECILHILNLNNKRYNELTLSNNFSLINIGSGNEISILNLAKKISKIIGFKGSIRFNKNYPDGTPRKLLDNSLINQTGWRHKVNLDLGIKITYDHFLKSEK